MSLADDAKLVETRAAAVPLMNSGVHVRTATWNAARRLAAVFTMEPPEPKKIVGGAVFSYHTDADLLRAEAAGETGVPAERVAGGVG